MTANTSIVPARFLHDRLASASPDPLRQLLPTFIDAVMAGRPTRSAAPRYGRPSLDRVNSRNGYRHRDFDTRAGTLDVAIPKLRRGATSRAGCWSGAAAPSGH